MGLEQTIKVKPGVEGVVSQQKQKQPRTNVGARANVGAKRSKTKRDEMEIGDPNRSQR